MPIAATASAAFEPTGQLTRDLAQHRWARDPQLDAICEIEARTFREFAGATAASVVDLVPKTEVLVARLLSDSAEVRISDDEAALLRSLLRDLTCLADVSARAVVCTTAVAGSDGDHAGDAGRPPDWP